MLPLALGRCEPYAQRDEFGLELAGAAIPVVVIADTISRLAGASRSATSAAFGSLTVPPAARSKYSSRNVSMSISAPSRRTYSR
ncbi:hypothetical protein BGV52_21810 [Burkholderia ubonensis]|nr:hypothetical protein BGV52_21810 [Burkholderia ubonensis]